MEGGRELTGRVRNSKVKQPIRRSSHRQSLRSHLQGEQFSSDDPRYWSPGAREEVDVEAHKGDGRTLSWKIIGAGNSASDGNDELAETHADCTQKEEVATS